MCVPVSGRVELDDTAPDFILFTEDLYFDVQYEEKMTGIGSGSREKYTMETGIEYVLWDNKNEKIAAYGKLHKFYNLLSLPTKDNYLETLELFAKSIVEKSPMVIKQTIF